MDLQVNSIFEDASAIIEVTGEVDVSNADVVRDALDEAIEAPDITSVGVDLSQVAYIDSTGIGVLVGAAHKSRDAEKSFAAIDPQDNVARVMGLLGIDEVIDVRYSEPNV